MLDWAYQARPNLPLARKQVNVSFRDINSGFLIESNQLLVEDEAATRQQIRNVLGTPIGSEDFLPTYGSNLPYRIMDPINEITAFSIQTDTIIALNTWMKDQILVSLRSRIIPLEQEDGYLVDIHYQNLLNNSLTQSSYSFEALR